MKRALIILALAAVVGLPFLLRPKQPALEAADDSLVIITPHNEALRYEYGRGFREWYKAKTGRTVAIDWRVIGGTSEITRYLESEYVSSFRNYWEKKLGKPWSSEAQAAFQDPGIVPGPVPASDTGDQAVRRAFLESDVTCGIDVFFGGGSFDFIRQANAGRLVDSGVMRLHPDWFRDEVIPQSYTGEPYWDPKGRWIGCVLSSYGMIFNRDALQRLQVEREPHEWDDLADPKLFNEVALCDPTKSSSISKAFENIIQQHIYREWDRLQRETGRDRKSLEAEAVAAGWESGLRLIQKSGANARYFTDSSQKPSIDVIQGNSAVGICIDFYGRGAFQGTAERIDGTPGRIGYYSPPDGTVISPDPVALLRGAPNRKVAVAFIEYTLSLEGQLLWNARIGTPGGTTRYELRRLPIRRDYYTTVDPKFRTDPEVNPFAEKNPLLYNGAWTGGDTFHAMALIIRVMCQDTHLELADAWKEIIHAGMPPAAIAELTNLSAVSYAETRGRIRQALSSKNKVDEIRLTSDLARQFREHYRRAAEIARGARKD